MGVLLWRTKTECVCCWGWIVTDSSKTSTFDFPILVLPVAS